MKAKTIVLLGSVALVTLSFTFASVKKDEVKNIEANTTAQQQSTSAEPVPAFVAETIVK
jgi:hypothetical protein